MSTKIFDADQHYYEAEDCFTRYASERMKTEKYVRWVTESDGKRRRLFVGGKEANVIGNPTFNPVAQPGIYHQTLKALEVGDDRMAKAFGELEPIRPEYRDRDIRLGVMDEQGVAQTLMFPTLGVTMEGFMNDDVDMLYDGFHAFNRWLDDDWGFAYKDRIFAAPYVSLMSLDKAIEELEWLIKSGAKLITLRPGPAYGRSPADPYFDPFWARVEEAGLLVTYHAFDGPCLLSKSYEELWAAPPQPRRPEHRLLKNVLAGIDVQIMDTLSALILHNLFGRFPKLKIATIELGCAWVSYLMKRLDHAGGMINRKIIAYGQALGDRPSNIFKRHVWVAPFPEENMEELIQAIGIDRVLMGSDWPHAECIPEPRNFASYLPGVDAKGIEKVMGGNIKSLIAC